MAATVSATFESRGVSGGTPHLSHSRLNRYLHCPEQYRLYYVERLRPRVPDASLVFGQLFHEALAIFFRTGKDPVTHFTRAWDELRGVDLVYGQRESWEKLRASGQALLEKFLREELPKLGTIKASEQVFTLAVTTLDLPFIGVIDLVAERDGRVAVVDFKTSASSYQDHEAALSDQLTAYQLAVPEADEVALCVFVKTAEPKIAWYCGKREPAQLAEYLGKVAYVAREIAGQCFYKRPGRWCGYCDYLPVCLGDENGVRETLVSAVPKTPS